MGANLKANGDVHHLDHFVIAVMDPDSGGKILQRGLGSVHLEDSKRAQHDGIFMKLGEITSDFFSGKSDAALSATTSTLTRVIRFRVPEGQYDAMADKIRRECSFCAISSANQAWVVFGSKGWSFRTRRATSSRSPKRVASAKPGWIICTSTRRTWMRA